MVAPLRYQLQSRILRKVLVSLSIGTLAYMVAERAQDDGVWAITLSVFIGGVTLVVQFLIEFEARLHRVEKLKVEHSARIERMVEQGFAKINEATELFRLVEESAVRTDTVTQLVRHATLISPTVPPLLSRFAQAEIGRVSSLLKQLSEQSNVIYEGEDRDWLFSLTQQVQSSIDATSLTTVDASGHGFTDGGLWSSDFGQRYLEIQREAIQRGVAVRRIFVVQEELRPSTEEDLAVVCRMHSDLGIEVRVLRWEAAPETLRDWLFDFVLFDDTISYEVTASARPTGSNRPTILNTRLELQPERVKTRVQRFKDLWDSASEPAAWPLNSGGA
jgi:hypothetical protein